MTRARLKRDDVVVEILQRWGDWRRTLSESQGWGGVDGERMPGAPGVHADPVMAEYLRTHQEGNGLFQYIEMSVREFHVSHQRVMVYRYVRNETFERIGQKLKIEEYIARSMHEACKGQLTEGIVGYVLVGRDRNGTEAYRRDFNYLRDPR